MHPVQHRVRSTADLLGPLAGIRPSGPDHVQGQKTFPGPGMVSRQGHCANRFGVLSPFGKVRSYHACTSVCAYRLLLRSTEVWYHKNCRFQPDMSLDRLREEGGFRLGEDVYQIALQQVGEA